MNQETINLLAHKAEVKIDKLNESKLKYLVLSMFAGMFVGLGCILIFTIGGQLHAVHSPATKNSSRCIILICTDNYNSIRL